MKIINVYRKTFYGYILDENIDSLPQESGVYMIYRCEYYRDADEVDLKELFYIGKATDLHQEIKYHKRREEFLAQAKEGEQICYSFCFVSRIQYDIIENALIFMQKPRLNDKLKYNYDHQDGIFNFSGKCGLIKYNDFRIVNKVVIPL